MKTELDRAIEKLGLSNGGGRAPRVWNDEKWAPRALVLGVVTRRPGCYRKDIRLVAELMGYPSNSWAVQWPLTILIKEGVIKQDSNHRYYPANFVIPPPKVAKPVDLGSLDVAVTAMVPERVVTAPIQTEPEARATADGQMSRGSPAPTPAPTPVEDEPVDDGGYGPLDDPVPVRLIESPIVTQGRKYLEDLPFAGDLGAYVFEVVRRMSADVREGPRQEALIGLLFDTHKGDPLVTLATLVNSINALVNAGRLEREGDGWEARLRVKEEVVTP